MEAKELIEEVVKKQRVTRYRLAKELHVTPSTVYHWESGRAKPNSDHLMELLRRAGRLAAMVIVGTVIGVTSAPQDASANSRTGAAKSSGIYTLYATLRRWLIWFGARRNLNATPATLAL